MAQLLPEREREFYDAQYRQFLELPDADLVCNRGTLAAGLTDPHQDGFDPGAGASVCRHDLFFGGRRDALAAVIARRSPDPGRDYCGAIETGDCGGASMR